MPQEKTNNIILNYEGNLDFEAIGNLIGKLQQIMKDEGEKVNVYKKILTVMIESLENAYKYCSDLDPGILPQQAKSKFYLMHDNNTYVLQVSNPVFISDGKRVKNLLDNLNALDPEGLKELYKDTITDGKFSSKGGAGLGFIEMAKLACEKLDYRFDNINDTFDMFTITIKVS